MREEELRTVLLVKALEEADRDGRVIPPADRVAAAREAKRNAGDPADVAGAEAGGEALSAPFQRLLAARAKALLEQVGVRHPFVRAVHALAGRVPWAGWLLFALGLLVGGALSALDGTRRINILAFPLLGLVAWNLAVYVSLALRAVSSRRAPGVQPRLLPRLLAHGGTGLVSRLVAKSKAFDSLLAEALARFSKEWFEAARPLLMARAARALHLSAAAIGIGLIAGLYLRGVGLDYQAGWSSTFLDARRAHNVASWMYAPAAWLTGIAIPEPAQFESLRWESPGGGERAARWIHLLAATALIFVVLPRLLLALIATGSILRWSRHAPLPALLPSYFRSVFSPVSGVIDRGVARVLPYAYEPSAEALDRLRAWLPEVVGASLPLDMRAAVPYGEEDAFLESFAERGGGAADVVVLLFNLASTPEDENHGTLLAGVRDWLVRERPQTQLLAVVDEAPYAGRMGGDSAASARVQERRDAWRDFAAARGVKAHFLRLGA